MKLATFRSSTGSNHIGIVYDGDRRLFDLTSSAEQAGGDASDFSSMLALIDAGDAGLEKARTLFAARSSDAGLTMAIDSVELLAPLPRPRQMRDCMSYETHIRQSGRGMRRLVAAAAGDDIQVAAIDAEPLAPLADVYRQLPIYYITNRMIVGAPGSTVVWPSYSNVMDYELEYGVVIGKTAANIRPENARDHIFGYTIFNDFSARDQQSKEMPGWLGPGKGKSFDGGNVIGPWIVTRDEIPDPYSLKAVVRVNGEVRCESSTAGMLFNFEQMLVHMSMDETISAGEVICSGTIGNGCGLETGIFLNNGDVVELEFERIGILRNKVVRRAS
ncbi:2-keto-4-pentenoate hydratase/2-oxohepta-3-ene-1,7-dioic acid hydratase in catechol pathway [Neorhizobium sp. 2083]|uniref:fumarylacetoacetate hydrolase family protein n=1 Tax=Neorhizobium sp. 2083 TaxID=2817762 RepID=UPI002859860A|nr:fumarylacetoacetate hydrolase family protein [Neorhizobium sp. 2083]MDR6817487.1 2-keto-4-pentenoate hydratase/2-oxohepta-3-ene-1,7-dioic acid hydratase in catechol pathway [Neorhizobium sp. 2083]